MDRQRAYRWVCFFQVAVLGLALAFVGVVFACLQPIDYTENQAGCPPREMSSQGYCLWHREDDFVHLTHLGRIPTTVIHISRGSGPGGNDVVTLVCFSHGRIRPSRMTMLDVDPPHGSRDVFAQSVQDRRTELYSDMGWPDPNPPAIPPLKR